MAALSQKARPRDGIRVDLQLIADMVEPGVRALDVGCGDGELLAYLVNAKRVDARGMELSQAARIDHVGDELEVDADGGAHDPFFRPRTAAAPFRKPWSVRNISGSSSRKASWPLSLSTSTKETLAAATVRGLKDVP